MSNSYHQPSVALVVRQGPAPGRQIDITEQVVTLGRHKSCDVQIDDPEVSRRHARITRSAAGYTIEDQGSANGTFVNGKRIAGPQPLKDGDLVRLGQIELAFKASSSVSSDEMSTMAGAEPQAPAYAPPPEPAYFPPPESAPPYAPPTQPAQPKVGGFPWVAVLIGALVLLCLCLLLVVGGYWFLNSQQPPAGAQLPGVFTSHLACVFQ